MASMPNADVANDFSRPPFLNTDRNNLVLDSHFSHVGGNPGSLSFPMPLSQDLFGLSPPTSDCTSPNPAASSSSSLFQPMPHSNSVRQALMNAPPPILPPRRPKTKIRYNFCVFCKNNGEDESYFLSHTLKDDDGTVLCPVLRAYHCPVCGATGPVAHTIKYCPVKKHNLSGDVMIEEEASITHLKRMRSSTGRLRAIHGAGRQNLPSYVSSPNGHLGSQKTHGSFGPIGQLPPPAPTSFGFDSRCQTPLDTPPTTPHQHFVDTLFSGGGIRIEQAGHNFSKMFFDGLQ